MSPPERGAPANVRAEYERAVRVQATGPINRELNEQAIKAARAAGQRVLDAYQAALESVKKLAEGSQLDWFTTLVTTQAEFTQRLGVIFLTAAREQLK